MHQTILTLSHRQARLCMQGRPPGSHLPPATHRPLHHYLTTAPPHHSQQGSQGRPPLVAPVPPHLSLTTAPPHHSQQGSQGRPPLVTPVPPHLARHQLTPAEPLDPGSTHATGYRCLRPRIRWLLGRSLVQPTMAPQSPP